MKPQQDEEITSAEFERMPYPLHAPEDGEKVLRETLPEDATAVLASLIDDLFDLVETWKVAAENQREKLTVTHPSHEVPMEYRAGMAEGLENAVRDVEKILAKIGH